MPHRRACRLRRGGFLRGRLGGDAEKAAVTAGEGVELVVAERPEPAERVFLAALAQAGGELLGGRRTLVTATPAVLRVAFAHGEAELDELVDEQAGGRLAETQAPAQLADGLRAVHCDRGHGLELAHGEIEREEFRASVAVDGREDLVTQVLARGDEPLVSIGLVPRALRRPGGGRLLSETILILQKQSAGGNRCSVMLL